MTRIWIAAAVAIVAVVAFLTIDNARRTADLGNCMQRGIDRKRAEGTEPVEPGGSAAMAEITRACENDSDAFAD